MSFQQRTCRLKLPGQCHNGFVRRSQTNLLPSIARRTYGALAQISFKIIHGQDTMFRPARFTPRSQARSLDSESNFTLNCSGML